MKGLSSGFKRNILFVISTSVTVLVSIILPLLSYVNPTLLDNLQISSAKANINGYSLESGDKVSLAGEWEFYWGKHIVSENLTDASPDLYVEIPSTWTDYKLNGNKLSNGGIASYRITAENIKCDKPLLICVENLPGGCQVFIDGKSVFSNRSVPGTEHNNKNVVETYASPIILDNSIKEHEIVIEVTCEFSSGLTSIPVLSTYDDHQSSEMATVAIRYALIGIVAFFLVGAIGLAIIHKNFDSQIWLILLCLVFIFRMLISGEGYMVAHSMFGDINYEIMVSLIYVSTYIIKLCMMMHLTNVLSLKISNTTLTFISALFLICAFVPYFIYDYIYIANSYMWLQAVAYLFDIYMIYKLCGPVIRKKQFAALYLVFYCITAAAIVIDNLYLYGYVAGSASSLMPIACCLFIGLVLFVHITDTLSFYKRAQTAAELEKELGDLNMTLMLSQIQPHFLYNALNTIKYLTKKDSKAAETAIVKFSGYLRANMDSLTQKEPIPIAKELDHVKNYIDIEILRFGNRLNVEYNIECEDFSVPPLTIQPIVENAIKHGVNQKPEGGTVTLKTKEDENNYYIIVEDDGVGFDVNEKKDDGRSHVGFANIKKRLSVMLNAETDVKSVVGEGTTVKITIPKKEKLT